MGRIFLEHMDGSKLYNCGGCDTNLTTFEELVSVNFMGTTGQAFLFNKVVNLTYSDVEVRSMTTGDHFVRDAFCKKCELRVGWIYEFAKEESQRYKEGKVLLEKALLVVKNGLLV